jgi:hypothetical protein
VGSHWISEHPRTTKRISDLATQTSLRDLNFRKYFLNIFLDYSILNKSLPETLQGLCASLYT